MGDSIEQKILSRIRKHEQGAAFSPKDFTDLGSRQAVDVAFHRLETKGAIRRILRGIYDVPRMGKLTGKPASPNVWSVAQTIARKNGWKILPSGETALNALGLSTQVPANYLFFTDGQNKSYSIGNTHIDFRHRKPKELMQANGKCSLVTQALKALGKNHIDGSVVEKLRSQLTVKERRMLLSDSQYATAWILDAVKKICRKDD